MKITTKGQVTIPREVRDKMGLLPHSEVELQSTLRGQVLKCKLLPQRNGGTKQFLVFA